MREGDAKCGLSARGLKTTAGLLLLAGIALTSTPASAGYTGNLATGAERAAAVLARRTAAMVDSRAFLYRRGLRAEEFRMNAVWVDELATDHARVRQMYNGVPVWGGEGIVHLANSAVYAMTNNFIVDLNVDVTPAVTAAAAEQTAISAQECPSCKISATSALWVARIKQIDRLTYRVELRIDGRQVPERKSVFVDAHSGEVLVQYNDLHTSTAATLYRGNVNIATTTAGGTHVLEDVPRRIGTFDFRSATASAFRLTDADDVWTATAQRTANDVHFASEAVMDYLRVVHNRNGIDGAGGPGVVGAALGGALSLTFASVHYGSAYNNAFWDGTKIVTGDGDGRVFGPLVALDIVAHEWFHGVTQYTAGLNYADEPGALNESVSDVFGAMVERSVEGESARTWMIGEDAFTPGTPGDALRYLNNPHLSSNSGYTADDQPDHYSERYTGTQDNGGVHINSGIPNYAFYLLAKGGTHHKGGTLANGIGADAAARIWFRALTTYLTSSTNFAGARAATSRAAQDLFGAGSVQQTSTQIAWCLVGVGSCPAFEMLANGGFENAVSPWVLSGSGTFFAASGNTPKTGRGNAYLGTTNNVAGSVYQQFSIPTGAAPAVSFALGVTSAETSTSARNDQLIVEVRSGSGALLSTVATFTNLDKTANGAYVARGSYSLAAFAGQTVRVQFRVANNGTLPTTFRIDDVSVR